MSAITEPLAAGRVEKHKNKGKSKGKLCEKWVAPTKRSRTNQSTLVHSFLNARKETWETEENVPERKEFINPKLKNINSSRLCLFCCLLRKMVIILRLGKQLKRTQYASFGSCPLLIFCYLIIARSQCVCRRIFHLFASNTTTRKNTFSFQSRNEFFWHERLSKLKKTRTILNLRRFRFYPAQTFAFFVVFIIYRFIQFL